MYNFLVFYCTLIGLFPTEIRTCADLKLTFQIVQFCIFNFPSMKIRLAAAKCEIGLAARSSQCRQLLIEFEFIVEMWKFDRQLGETVGPFLRID